MTENRDEELTRLRAELAQAQARLAYAELRVAQGLHDGACQTLGGVALMAHVLSRKLQSDQPERAREVAELGALVEHAAGELRDLVRELRSVDGDGSEHAPE